MAGRLSRRILGILVCLGMAAPALAQTQKPSARSAPAATTYRGCLQGDAAKGFALMSPTGNGSDSKGQMKTYKVVPASPTVNLAPMANKVVEVSGTLTTDASAAGKIPAPDVMGDRKVTDSNHSEPASVSEGMKVWADGTLTVRSVRQVANSCAARSDGK